MLEEKKLKDGTHYIIEKMKLSDAVNMIDYLNSIAGESDNLNFGIGDMEFTIEQQETILKSVLPNELNYFALAKIDDVVIGNVNFRAGDRPRTRHSGEFGLSVLKKYWANGIAGELLSGLLIWAQENEFIAKVNLQVREDNENAIKLYKKHGFEIEGLLRRTFLIDGIYYNSYQMGKLID